MKPLTQNTKINLAGVSDGKFNRSVFVYVCFGGRAGTYGERLSGSSPGTSLLQSQHERAAAAISRFGLSLQQSLSAANTLISFSSFLSNKASVAARHPQGAQTWDCSLIIFNYLSRSFQYRKHKSPRSRFLLCVSIVVLGNICTSVTFLNWIKQFIVDLFLKQVPPWLVFYNPDSNKTVTLCKT